MADNFSHWCNQVTDLVRFAPDHKAIAQELQAHYEDHKQALLDLGYDEETAAQRSLEAMGDAQEVGAALNRVHSYWLGLLWQASRVLVVLALALVLVGLWKSRDRVEDPLLRTQSQLAWEAPPETAVHTRAYNADVFWDLLTLDETPEGWTATARLWVQMDTPLGFGPGDAVRQMELRDDQGPLPRLDRFSDTANGFSHVSPTADSSWTNFSYTLSLTLDHKPAWVEVAYPYGAAPFALRDTWKEGTP